MLANICSNKRVKLREWAAREGVHYQAAWRWWRDGKLLVPARQTETGTILAGVPVPGRAAGAVLSARVSSHNQHADLDRQVAGLTEWATVHDVVVVGVVCEVGSGLNGTRPKLRRVLPGPSATVIGVEHRDRLACFGVGYLGAGPAGCWWPMLARPLMTWCGT
jgi:putative resolvase